MIPQVRPIMVGLKITHLPKTANKTHKKHLKQSKKHIKHRKKTSKIPEITLTNTLKPQIQSPEASVCPRLASGSFFRGLSRSSGLVSDQKALDHGFRPVPQFPFWVNLFGFKKPGFSIGLYKTKGLHLFGFSLF